MLMLSCYKATELMERKSIGDLRAIDRSRLYVHTRMCNACKLYEKQSWFLDTVLRRGLMEPDEDSKAEKELPDTVRSKIIKELECR